MLINILLWSLLIGYSIWTLVRFFKASKQGKCAGCSIKNSCNTKCN
ncbi:FeoB-associated Cys-rich membrane protein [Bacillus sp. HMF5848]|nr:FeoB-associated Cys-rich membrane protein [Bacillus sp. HMF5848]RSK25841.1 FeoB-associated Cys-rich membrane protein [Bacillus sp. HMF5848]